MKGKAKSSRPVQSHEISDRFSQPRPKAEISRRKAPRATSTALEKSLRRAKAFYSTKASMDHFRVGSALGCSEEQGFQADEDF